MQLSVIGRIGAVFEESNTHWVMVRLDSCACHCPLERITGKQNIASPHVFRVYDLPVDADWLRKNKGKEVEIVTSMSILAQKAD